MKDQKLYSTERVKVSFGGHQRSFIVVTPTTLAARPAGLFYFHGSLQTGNVARNFTGRSFDEMAVATGSVLVYPDGVERHFNDARRSLNERCRELGIDDVGFTHLMVEWLSTHRGVDSSSIYGTGYSNGGQMVIRLLHDAPGLLAGAATFAATMPAPDNIADGISPYSRPTPYLATHGTADRIVKYAGGEAGLDPAHSRGVLISAFDSADYFAAGNGLGQEDLSTTTPSPGIRLDRWSKPGHAPVELWSIEGLIHLVPPQAPQLCAEFFGLQQLP